MLKVHIGFVHEIRKDGLMGEMDLPIIANMIMIHRFPSGTKLTPKHATPAITM